MVNTYEVSMGDRDCYYGEKVWQEVEVICDECENPLGDDEVLYEYEPGKWCCLECLKEKFETKTVAQAIEEAAEQHYASLAD